MKQIIQEVFGKIEVTKTLQAVMNNGPEKLTASAIGMLILDLGTVMALFILLAIIDIITKCASLAAELWNRTYGTEFTKRHGNFLAFLRWCPAAYDWRLINSHAMKTGFVSKIITYMLMIIAACVCDALLPLKVMRTLVVSVLACTELISVCENLSLCNIAVAGHIKSLVSRRKEQIK